MIGALALVVLAQVGQTQQKPDLEEIRTWLHQQFVLAVAQVDEFEKETDVRFGIEPDQPQLGVELDSRDEGLGGDHPPRHTYVTGVFKGSPADKAGIKPGDRILAIGEEELDFENGIAVRLYLANHPDTVPLKIGRDGQVLTLNVPRAPLPCMRIVYDRFDQAKWLHIWDQSKQMLQDMAKTLETPGFTLPQLEHAHQGLQANMMLWSTTLGLIDRDLAKLQQDSCQVTRK